MRNVCTILLLALLPAERLLADVAPAEAKAVLEKHCAACHAVAGKSKGGLDAILDRTRLVALGHLKPGLPAQSPLWQQIESEQMPPATKPRLSEAEKTLLRSWIREGAVDWVVAVAVKPLSPSEVYRAVRADLESLDSRQRRFQRYVSFAHLAPLPNAGKSLDLHRAALTKLVNALSWSPRLVPPTPIDAGRLVYRLDLRDYRWNARVWDRLASLSPYPLAEELPLLRGDWFIVTAARPPFYYDFLQLPSTEKGLERLLQVDAATNLAEDRVARAGFTNSGVARHNRLLERQDSAFGAYWRSYDFKDNVGRQNLFENPLGPAGTGRGFIHAGGEMVFALPNGLHGYFVSDDTGRRIDRAPVEIVSDPKRPDKTVEVGVSCFSCHARGYIPKDDMIRGRVKAGGAFTADEKGQVLALYPPAPKLKALLDEDNVRFRKSLESLGLPADADDPIEGVFQRYEAVVDSLTASAELGTTLEEMSRSIASAETLRRPLGALIGPGGMVPRVLWEEQFAILSRDRGTKSVRSEEPKTDHTGAIRAIAVGPGDRIVTGGEDRVAIVRDAATLAPVQRLVGHTNEILAVSFLNEREVLTASADRTVRLWDISSGKELRRFTGATDRLRTLAVSTDGRIVFAAGDDRMVRGWNATTGEEVFTFAGHTGSVLALAVDPTGGVLASAGSEGVVRRWEIVRGSEIAAIEVSPRAIRAMAFSPNGEQLLLGGEDRQATMLSREGKVLWRHEAGRNSIVHVGFVGDRAVTASSQYRTEDVLVLMSDPRNGRESASLPGTDLGRVEVLVVCQRQGRTEAILAQGERLRRVILPAR